MSDDLHPTQETPAQGSGINANEQSALFANLILQQSNMAMLLMGKTKAPGQDAPMKDLEAARLFIDQLEMLEVKTKGNLTKEESRLLGQTLMALRLGFVEAVEEGDSAGKPEAKTAAAPEKPADSPAGQTPPPAEESHKKFSKKY
jgi:hypothetical protein